MNPIRCTFWKTTGQVRRFLTVCATGEDPKWTKDCRGTDAHRAELYLDIIPDVREADGCHPYWPEELIAPNAWPRQCDACGVLFDSFPVRSDMRWRVYRHIMPRIVMTDGSQFFTVDKMPVGAMWEVEPHKAIEGSVYWRQRGGGMMLLVRTPGGDWNLDRPSHGGKGWERTGVPPDVTAQPSCQCDPPSGWHGWLKDGILSDA